MHLCDYSCALLTGLEKHCSDIQGEIFLDKMLEAKFAPQRCHQIVLVEKKQRKYMYVTVHLTKESLFLIKWII
jgi:hypothetical protein